MTSRDTRRGAKEGIGFGIAAGLLFAVAEVIAAAAQGMSPWQPLRMIASVALGRQAYTGVSLGTAIFVALIVHVVLSAAFGLGYGVLNAQLSLPNQTRWPRQIAIGILFGAGLWFLNFQIIARAFYPWLVAMPQGMQLFLHALFYGLPLGLLYARAERRIHGVRRAAPAWR